MARSNPVIWGGFGLALVLFSLVLLPKKPDSPWQPAPPASSVTVFPPAPLVQDWPPMRFLDPLAGTWEDDTSSGPSFVLERKQKPGRWVLTITLHKDAPAPMSCTLSPEYKDGGFYGACSGEELYIRFKMNQDRRVFSECVYFESVFRRKDGP